jgi:ribosomal protein S18 acetylase RimI-like enzyme
MNQDRSLFHPSSFRRGSVVWMPHLTIAMTRQDFDNLPRNGAFRYQFADGVAKLTPRPIYYRARLDLHAADAVETLPPDPRLTIRPLADDDWEVLPNLFADAFEHMQPFGSLERNWRQQVAGSLIAQTREGGDGPFLSEASVIACDRVGNRLGALLLTLAPSLGAPGEDTFVWQGDVPPSAIAHHLGRPHLTWVFVASWAASQGIGTHLLAEACQRLRTAGFTELVTTFIRGNEASALWHWRNGFRLLPRQGL